MQETQKLLSKKSERILGCIIILVIMAMIAAMVLPIYQSYKVTRRAKAEAMAPLIDEIYRFYHEENQWPDEEQVDMLAQNLGMDLGKEEWFHFSGNPDHPEFFVRVGGRRYLYYYFTTPENKDSGNHLGWYLCTDGTYYSYEPEDWPELKNAPK